MENQLTHKTNQVAIQKGLSALSLVLRQYLGKQIELGRIVRVAVLLMRSGVNQNNSIFQEIAKRCLVKQKDDGGWIGVEDSIWCIAFLKDFEEYSQVYINGLNWLGEQRLENGEWGNTKRDMGRIPITALVVHFHPEISSKKTISWLENEWNREKEKSPLLTYKGAFILLGLKASADITYTTPLIEEIYTFLANEQNDDGGFGPWKDHPIGSEPWSTGIVLLGLLSYPELLKKEVIEKAVDWLAENQLHNGLWPYHYIEEGSAWALYGLIESYKYLKKC